jgi:hypothetical protein
LVELEVTTIQQNSDERRVTVEARSTVEAAHDVEALPFRVDGDKGQVIGGGVGEVQDANV